MSLSETGQIAVDAPMVDAPAKQDGAGPLDSILNILRSKYFLMAVAVLGALVWCFWPWFRGEIWDRWMDMDSYYAHGVLIPLCSAYLIYDRWDKIKNIPVKAFWPALIPLLILMYIGMPATRSIMTNLLSFVFVACIAFSMLFVAGWKWLKATLAPIMFTFLGLPVFEAKIDQMTLPLQMRSTDIAYFILHTLRIGNPYREEPTIIHLDNFQLYVAAACSGLKTTIAVSAAVIFFMLISKMRWWANLILAAIAIPLSLMINGIRISMIGAVGNAYGAEAGMKFHDYSGYIALILCFLILGFVTKKLETK
jgi:exosortase